VGYLVFYALLVAVLIGYLALGTVQALAITAGLERRGFGKAPAVIVALLLAWLPIIGSAAAVRGATAGWGWTTGRGLVRFFGPLIAIAAVLLLG
jgi:hypothetical protein